MQRFGWLAFAAAQSICTLASAQVQPPAARASLIVLRSDGARDCPDAEALAERVRTVAGGDVIAGGASTARIETWVQVAISRNFEGFAAEIRTSGRHRGTRVLEDLGPTCHSLADAVAVTIAMFLDPYEAPSAQLQEPASSAGRRLPEPQAQAVNSSGKTRRFSFDGSAGIAFNLLQHGQPFLTLGLGYRPSARWSLALGGTFVFPDHKLDGTRSVDLSLSMGFFQVCVRALGDVDRASLAWCAAPQLGSLAGSGRGYQSNFSKRAWWFALAIGPEADFRFTRSLSWVLSGQAVIPLLEQAFDVESEGVRSSAFQTASVAGLVSLGLRGHL